MIGVKPLFAGKNLAEGDPAKFDVIFVSPEGEVTCAQRLAL